MTWDLLVESWRKRVPLPSALIVKGKGCTWTHVEALRWDLPGALIWTLNDDLHHWTDLHFDVHVPRHHRFGEHIPQLVHWSTECADHPWNLAFPIATMPRRKFGCTTAYMLGLAWLLLDTWPKLQILAPGCDYNGTARERETEKFSILYWLGRIEEKKKRRVRFDARSRLLIDEDYR